MKYVEETDHRIYDKEEPLADQSKNVEDIKPKENKSKGFLSRCFGWTKSKGSGSGSSSSYDSNSRYLDPRLESKSRYVCALHYSPANAPKATLFQVRYYSSSNVKAISLPKINTWDIYRPYIQIENKEDNTNLEPPLFM